MSAGSRVPADTHFSPTPGCIIMIVAALLLGGSLAYSIYRGIEMNREIDKFTEPAGVSHPVDTPSPEQRQALREKLSAFSGDAVSGQPAELNLSAQDLNHLIASEPLLRDFRGTTRVADIEEGLLIVDISQVMNSLLPGRPRYLNATFHFKPQLEDGVLVLSLVDITVPGKEIPDGFVELYAQKNYFQFDNENESFGPALGKVRHVACGEHALTLSTGAPPAP